MTISEQLHFSILSAPIAGTDRRALSQAWYSALYRANGKRRLPGLRAIPNQGKTAAISRPPVKSSRSAALSAVSRAGHIQSRIQTAAAGERRSPQLRLARQIEALVRRRASATTAATFILDGTRARVRVLVVAGGGSVRLIAICSKHVRDSVARALEQARYASAAHGIVLHASTREEALC